MCRKNQLRGWCAVCFGLGLMIGLRLNSWLLCVCGGAGFVLLGLLLIKRR